MIKKLSKNLLIAGAMLLCLSFDLPSGWFAAGSKPKSYDMGIAQGAGQDGKNAATIKSVDKEISGFGTLMQQCKPDKYLGKRIKLTGFIKAENAKGWAGLWIRVDQQGSDKPLSFDNMFERKITGTADWKKYELVVDVPAHASLIAYGALLDGTGQIWFDNMTIEVVDNSVATTGSVKAKPYFTQIEPVNLDFEK